MAVCISSKGPTTRYVSVQQVFGSTMNGFNLSLEESPVPQAFGINIFTLSTHCLFLVIISLFSTQVQRLTHLMLLYNYIYLASAMEYHKNLKFAKFYALCCSLFLLYRMCFHGSQGTMPVFISHFTIG